MICESLTNTGRVFVWKPGKINGFKFLIILLYNDIRNCRRISLKNLFKRLFSAHWLKAEAGPYLNIWKNADLSLVFRRAKGFPQLFGIFCV